MSQAALPLEVPIPARSMHVLVSVHDKKNLSKEKLGIRSNGVTSPPYGGLVITLFLRKIKIHRDALGKILEEIRNPFTKPANWMDILQLIEMKPITRK